MLKKHLLSIITASGLLSSAFAESSTYWNEQTLRANSSCLLSIVRSKMNSTKTSALPELKFSSSTSLEEFQAAIEQWWGFRPEKFVNVYDANTNTLYLNNNKASYKNSRTPVDSLVHELVHFVQSKDFNASHEDGEYLEDQAVQVQTWFRDNYGLHIQNEDYQGPCK